MIDDLYLRLRIMMMSNNDSWNQLRWWWQRQWWLQWWWWWWWLTLLVRPPLPSFYNDDGDDDDDDDDDDGDDSDDSDDDDSDEPRPPLPSLCNESQALPDHYRWHLRWNTKYGKGDDDDDDYENFLDNDGSDGDSPLLNQRPSISWFRSLDSTMIHVSRDQSLILDLFRSLDRDEPGQAGIVPLSQVN